MYLVLTLKFIQRNCGEYVLVIIFRVGLNDISITTPISQYLVDERHFYLSQHEEKIPRKHQLQTMLNFSSLAGVIQDPDQLSNDLSMVTTCAYSHVRIRRHLSPEHFH
ncbi:hypothetical protein TNCV_119471 [Trichonephila clavipes]|nr:hypothetical protein TNCV_119471 [Trichonephila clavipes]